MRFSLRSKTKNQLFQLTPLSINQPLARLRTFLSVTFIICSRVCVCVQLPLQETIRVNVSQLVQQALGRLDQQLWHCQ